MKRQSWIAIALLAGVAAAQTPPKSSGAPDKRAAHKTPAKKQDKKKPQDPRSMPRPENAKDLFRGLRDMRGLEATFTEEKHLALLVVPLKSSGKLYFRHPGYLCRKVLKPQPSTVTITPTELRVMGDGKKPKEVIDLRASADVRQFVTSLVQVFRGDSVTLDKTYAMRFTPDKAHKRRWSLMLKPKAAPLNRMLESLTLSGEGRDITTIEIVEPKGDKTVTRIQSANPKRVFTAAEQKQLFGIEPKTKKTGKAKQPR